VAARVKSVGWAVPTVPLHKVYPLPSCPGYDRVSEKNAVLLSTEAEVRKAGYRKAKNCP